MKKRALAAVLVLAATFSGPDAFTQELTAEERAAGEKLYEDGVKLLEQKKYAEACPVLARAVEVTRRQGIGGILALAECREGEGKTASAWTLYREARSRAEIAGQRERADLAKAGEERVSAQLHYVEIENAAELLAVEGLEVTIDGAKVSTAVLSTPIAADPGSRSIVLRAPGRDDRTVSIEVPPRAGSTKVKIDLTKTQTQVVAPPVSSPGLGGGQIAGLTIGSIGLAAMIAGGALLIVAKNKYPEGCELDDGSYDFDTCGSPGIKATADDARTLGTIGGATLFPGLGIVVAGVVVFFASPSGDPEAAAAALPIRFAAPGADAGISLTADW